MKALCSLKRWQPMIVAAALVAGMWIGFIFAGGDEMTPSQQKLNRIFSIIDEQYVDEIEPDSLVELTIPFLIQSLDPHSQYIAAADIEKANQELQSSFSGIGVQFYIMSDTICVVEVISGGPSDKVGLEPGDRIIAVDGRKVAGVGFTNDDVLNTLRGPSGSRVQLTIKRPSVAKTIGYTITRSDIPSPSVNAHYLTENNMGYIKLSKFAEATYVEFLQSAMDLLHRGAQGLIIDLRGNGGGFMEPALMVANEFLSPGQPIIETRGRNVKDNENWLADGTGALHDVPVAVLIDELSASASEILSGALQDNDRGIIIGRRSFGKGLVQRIIQLPDSSELKLTVQRYYTPSGRCIQKNFKRGENVNYENEVIDRYYNGETFNADSVKFDESLLFHTAGGRTVYGGGGIMPDVFVPSDTMGVTSYYMNVVNADLLQNFAFEYADLNRADLTKAKTVGQLLRRLPSDGLLLSSFVYYASQKGVPARWYYINISRTLIVNQLKAIIVRNILGWDAFYEVLNSHDPVVLEAIKHLHAGTDPLTLDAMKDIKKAQSKK